MNESILNQHIINLNSDVALGSDEYRPSSFQMRMNWNQYYWKKNPKHRLDSNTQQFWPVIHCLEILTITQSHF